jgi:hypothetical protein
MKEKPTETELAHLFGGPMDGTVLSVEKHTHGIAMEDTRAVYTFCPHATALFERTTFISADLSHDICAR